MAQASDGRVLGQYIGIIKSFNQDKGFGFIMSDQLKAAGFLNDVFVHHRQKGNCGVGDAVTFLATLNTKGQPQAQHVVPIVSGSQDLSAQLAAAVLSGRLGAGSVGDAVLAALNARAQAQNLLPIAGGGAEVSAARLLGATPTESTFFRGVIKSFSTKNNYGFIESDQIKELGYQNDVYLTSVQMGECTVGDEVFFEVCINSSGQPQTKGIVALAQRGPGPRLARKAPGGTAKAAGELLGDFVGEVRSFSSLKGYGFIGCKQLKDLGYEHDAFLHHTRATAVGVGDAVSFTAYLNDKGQPQARNVAVVGLGPTSRKRSGEDLGVPLGVLKRAKMAQAAA